MHFVVIFEYGIDNEHNHCIAISGVAHSLKEARKILAKSSEDEKEYAIEHGFIIYADDEDEFRAGEAGNYEGNHAHFYILEV